MEASRSPLEQSDPTNSPQNGSASSEPINTSHRKEQVAQCPEAQVVVDQPIKDVALKADKSWPEKLSTLLSGLSGCYSDPLAKGAKTGQPAWICGRLYAARAEALRQTHLPLSPLAEDGLLYHMVVTDSLRRAVNPH